MTLTIGSLFSGYAGLDMAVAAATGAETAWFFEYDDGPAAILQHHFPDVPNYRDVTTADWASVPPVDIICGGSPCQDLSTAGKRAGMAEGTRSNLWVAMREAIATIRPRLVVWENVQGALSAKAVSESDMELGSGPLGEGVGRGGYLRALGRVLGDLADLGYDAQWTTVRASDVGAPHHRARVFLVAHPADTAGIGLQAGRAGGQVWPALPGVDGGEAPLPGADVTHLPTPRTSDHRGAAEHGEGGMDLRTAVSYLPTPNASDGTGGGVPMSTRRGHSRQLIDAVLDLPLLPTPTTRMQDDTASQRERNTPGLGIVGVHFNNESVFGKYAAAVERWEKATGMPAPAPTELNRNGRPRLTTQFAEWMMGLPPGWVSEVPGLSRANQLKAVGNGVCPQQATAALNHLLGDTAP